MEEKKSDKYIYALGRRKESVAQVRLYPNGSGKMTVNDKDYKDYFSRDDHQRLVESPFQHTGTQGKFDITVRVVGGGVTGQADSVRLGISRALLEINPDFRTSLKKLGFLTRDARKKERKKFGKKSARRAPQFSKR